MDELGGDGRPAPEGPEGLSTSPQGGAEGDVAASGRPSPYGDTVTELPPAEAREAKQSGDTVTVDPALDTSERAAAHDDPFRTVAPDDPAARPTRGDTVRRKRPPKFAGQDTAAGGADHDTTAGGTGRGSRATLPPGTVLGGCRLDKLLGQGGMATVYQGEQLDLGREVAVKVLKTERTRDQEFVKGFMREAKTLARLDHPNIVTIHNVGQEAGNHFLVMQLVTGGTLLDKVQKQGRFRPEEAVKSIRSVAKGLQAAHRKGIIHRDVKPGNILLTADGVPVISDFGIARTGVTGETLGVGLVLGTAHYMPPEQVDAAPIDARSDIYALGASFYHLLTGQPPFKGSSVIELMLKQVSEPLIPPHQRDSTVPEGLSRVVCRMMAKRPDDRYQTMEEVLEALDHPEDEPTPAPAANAAGRRLLVEASDVGAVDVGAPWVPPKSTPLTPAQPIKRPLPAQATASTAPPTAVPATPPEAAKAPEAAPRPARLGSSLRVVVLATALLGAAAFLATGLAPSGEETDVGQARAELDADLAWRRLEEETAASPAAERQARIEAFARERTGTARGVEAGRVATEMERTATAARVEALARARTLRAEGSIGPALLALAGLAASAEVAALTSDLRLDLERSGMAWIPPGSFVSGAGASLADRKLDGFYIDRREVTRADYHVHARDVGARVPWGGGEPDAETGGLPVTGISLAEAEAFALARGKRLPGAWEWERAARGETGQGWPWGPEPDPQAFNWGGSTGQLRPAGSFPGDLSPHGCLDMAGNAAEITFGGSGNQREVWIRGGSFATRQLENARPAFWLVVRPGEEQHPAIGFRCAADRLPGAGER